MKTFKETLNSQTHLLSEVGVFKYRNYKDDGELAF